MHIYPAILTGNPDVLDAQLLTAQQFDDCSIVQIDIIDGDFADNLTVTPTDLCQAPFGDLQLDLHLMTVDPEDFVYEASDFASQLPIRAVIAQVERMGSEASFVAAVRDHNWKPGLSLDLGTDLESIDPEIWQQLAVVQVMGVPAGAQAQPFARQSLELVKELIAIRQRDLLSYEIILDGGVTFDILTTLMQQVPSLDSVAVGSFIWKNAQPNDAWQLLRQYE